MSGGGFVDTNVLVYTCDPADAAKRLSARQYLEREDQAGVVLCVSSRGLTEFRNALRKKKAPILSESDADAALRAASLAYLVAPIDAACIREALDIKVRYTISFLDALVVASAHAAGCTRLLTEDLNHGQDGVGAN